MTKLEFMAMSLPYGLKCQYIGKVLEDKNAETENFILKLKIAELKKIEIYRNYWKCRCGIYQNGLKSFINGIECFPILHPLLDLTKEIEHKGEKFVPIVELAKITNGCTFRDNWKLDFETAISESENHGDLVFNIVIIRNKIETFTFHNRRGYWEQSNNIIPFIQKLIEWHFDIAGLIEKGEAIDLNTLETNHYK